MLRAGGVKRQRVQRVAIYWNFARRLYKYDSHKER